MKVTKNPLKLYASAKAVITQFLHLPGENRISNVIQRVKNLNANEVECCLEKVMKEFAYRHRNISGTFMAHFHKVNAQYENDLALFSERQKLLLGHF